ncbi:hypothetical protein ACQX0N_05540 [Clostridium tepidum]
MKKLNEKELLNTNGGYIQPIAPKVGKYIYAHRKQIADAIPKKRWRGPGGTY